MERLEAQTLASILASTSSSNIADLLSADHTWKARAADQLARDIVRRLNEPAQIDCNQLRLPF
ncbi:DUF6771 family protein [Sphingomonas olei]